MLNDEEGHDILHILYKISTVTEFIEWQFNVVSTLLRCADKKYVNDEFRAEL